MATWQQLEFAEPALAEQGRWLLTQNDGVAFLATVRRGGSPQVHPIMPYIAEGRLWALIVSLSSKHGDLLRDGRYALHAIPAGPENLELHLEGRARLDEDPAARAAVEAAAGRSTHDFESLFELGIERALGTRWSGWGTAAAWPEYTRWRAER